MNVIGNNKGFSIMETVVASAIAVMLSAVTIFIFTMAMDVFIRSIRMTEAESEALSAMYAVKSSFAQSVNVTYGGVASAANNAYTGRTMGAIRPADVSLGRVFSTGNINGGAMSNCASETTWLLMTGLREMNTQDQAAPTAAVNKYSHFAGNALYFQRPCFTGGGTNSQSGALYVDNERLQGSWVRLSPINAPIMFTRLTEFHIDDVSGIDTTGGSQGKLVTVAAGNIPVGATALSADVRMVVRYFTKGLIQHWQWCPQIFMPGGGSANASCTPAENVKYYDLEKRMKIVFTNNSYNRDQYLAERPFGRVYFFRSWVPTSREGL